MGRTAWYFSLLMTFSLSISGQSKTFINVRGKEIIGPDGKNFLIRGTNLGNWLVPEGYMFKFKNANSPRLINQILTELIGPDATADSEPVRDSAKQPAGAAPGIDATHNDGEKK